MSRRRRSSVSTEIERLGASGEELLKCPLCLDIFDTPRALACLHTFCEPCLKFYIQDAKSSARDGKLESVVCPICKKPSVPPDVNKHPHVMVKDFPLNHFILPLLETVPYRSRTRATTRSRKSVSFQQCCGTCSERGRAIEATAYCQECEDFQCSECVENHSKIKLLIRHTIVDIDKVSDGLEVAKTFNKHYVCQHHQTQDLRFYCANHDVIVCSDCIVVRHKACEILTELDDLGLTVKQSDQPTRLKDNLKGLQKALSNMIDTARANNYGLTRESEEIPRRIETMKAKVLRLFEYLEQATSRKLSALLVEHGQRNTESAYRYKQILAAIEASVGALDAVLEHGTYSQVFLTFNRLKDQLQEYDTIIKTEKDSLTCSKILLKMDDAFQAVVDTVESLGDVHVETIKPDLAEMPPLLFLRREETVDELKPELVSSFTMKTSDENITRECTDVAFMDNKVAVLCTVKNRTWFSYTLTLCGTEKMEELFNVDLKRNPKNVFAIENTQLVVTYPVGGFIEFYTFTQQKAKKKKKPMPITFELSKTVKCDIRDCIITRFNKREFAISTDNHFGTMTHEGVAKQLFYYSVSLRAKESNFWSTQLQVEHVVVDFKKKRVYLSSSKPDKLMCFTTKGELTFDLSFDYPITSLDLDPEGNIIVCSGMTSAGKLFQVSPYTGKIMKHVGLETRAPRLVCFNRKGTDFYVIPNGKEAKIEKYRYNKLMDEDLLNDDE